MSKKSDQLVAAKVATASIRARRLQEGFRVFADVVTEAEPVKSPGLNTGLSDSSTRVVPESVYQISNHKGARKRYVRVIQVFGDGNDLAECELIHAEDADGLDLVGSRLNCSVNTLCDPDQYPKYQFSPEVWLRKVTQPLAAKKKEVAAIVDAYLECNRFALAGLGGVSVGATLSALAKILKPIFGGMTLVLLLSWIKRKIEASMPSENDVPKQSFNKKISEMFRTQDKKQAERLTFRSPQQDTKFGITEKEQKERAKSVPAPMHK